MIYAGKSRWFKASTKLCLPGGERILRERSNASPIMCGVRTPFCQWYFRLVIFYSLSISSGVRLDICESRTRDFIYVLMNQYIRFCADRLLRKLKQPTIYKVINPFPWMDTISLQGKTNFFEKRVSEYAKSGVNSYYKQPWASRILPWWKLLNCATSPNYLFFSIYLPIYVTQSCTRGQSQTSYMVVLLCLAIQTARCYLHMLFRLNTCRKHKLLGALYWLTDWLTFTVQSFLINFSSRLKKEHKRPKWSCCHPIPHTQSRKCPSANTSYINNASRPLQSGVALATRCGGISITTNEVVR
jgi:hypothetical protein